MSTYFLFKQQGLQKYGVRALIKKKIKERLSKSNLLVLDALEELGKLSSAQEICFWLKEHNVHDAPGLTTVYRAVENLVKLKLIQAVDIGDKERRYEPIEPGEHHHHLFCTSCLKSIHLDECFIEKLAETIERHHQFKMTSHVLELFGVCEACVS